MALVCFLDSELSPSLLDETGTITRAVFMLLGNWVCCASSGTEMKWLKLCFE